MAGQVPEQVAPDVAGDGDEGEIADPACESPQQIIGGDQRAEQDEGRPHAGIDAVRQGVDQKLDAVLRAHRTGDGAQDRGEDERMGQRALPNVTKDKGKGTGSIIAKVGHALELRPGNAATPSRDPYSITTPSTRNLSAARVTFRAADRA